MSPNFLLTRTLEEILERLTLFAVSLQETTELDQLLTLTVQEGRTLLAGDRVLIYQLLPDGDGVVIAESVGARWTSIVGQLIYDPCLQHSWVDSYQQGRVSQIDDVATSQLAPCHIDLLTRLQVKANLVIPIGVKSPTAPAEGAAARTLWGLLVVHQCSAARLWQSLDVKLGQHLATQLGLALDAHHRCAQTSQFPLPSLSSNPHSQPEDPNWAIATDEPFHRHYPDAMLAKLSEQVPGVIYQYRRYPDGRTCFPYASAAIRQIYEVTPAQVQEDASDVLQRLHPHDGAAVMDSIAQSAQTLHLWHQEYRVVLPQRGLRWLEGHAMPESLPDGSVLWHGYIWDITARKQAETLQQLQSTALAACADVIMITDHTGTIEWVNHSYTTLTGYTSEESIGKNPRELVRSGHHDRAFYQHLWKTILSGQVWRGEMINRRKDGCLYVEEATITPVYNEQGKLIHFVAIKQDISARKHMEATLQKQTERERMMYKMAQHIRQSLDLDFILNTTVAQVRQFLQSDRVIIYQFQPDWSGIVVTESVAADCQSILHWGITDTFFAETRGQTYHSGTVKMISNIYEAGLASCHLELLESLQVQAKLIVPILQDEQVWGLLVVHQCRGPRTWQPFEGEMLSQLATQVAIAIHQSELWQQVQQLNTGLELQVQERTAALQQSLNFEALLKRITDQVRDSLDEQQILQTIVQELAQGLQLECCDTGIYDATQTTSTIACEFTISLSVAQGKTFAIADCPHPELYPQLFQGKSCQFCDISPQVVRPDQQWLTVLACPIMDDQGILGDLWLFRHYHDLFTEQEVRLVQQVANHCAIALRQSRLYRATEAQVEELARLNQLKDDFLSTVSHELRTPMSSMKMAMQMLELRLRPLGLLDDDTSPINRYFQILQMEFQREMTLINDLLDLARINSEPESINVTPIYLQFWLPHMVTSFTERINSQQQQLELTIANNLPPLMTDLSYLERAIAELLHNACKYTAAGETITVAADLAPADDTVSHALSSLVIQISNSGVEIAVDQRDRIFERFYRIPNNDPWKYGGTGLGLAIVKKLVEQMGGAIAVTSANHATHFTLTFPLAAQ